MENMFPLGQCLVNIVLYNKYGIQDITFIVIEKEVKRLTNQLWKLIPMKENNEAWERQLNTVLLEIVGINEFFNQKECLLQLISKLEGILQLPEVEFTIYRKTIFECITLLQDLKRYED